MLHELILALYGCPGSVFIESSSGIRVAKGISFLHPSEIVILDKLCILGSLYKKLNNFIHLHHFSSSVEHESNFCGLYFREFCSSLNYALGPYRKTLLNLEQDILKDPHISLSHIQYELDKYYMLFPALEQILQEIQDKKIHGCLLLDVVFKHSVSGYPLVKDAMNKILERCHSQLFKQLSAWMFHGMILDPYSEFFIKKITDQEQHLEQDGSISDMGHYSLNPHMLPSYIPSSVALKILFIGSASSLFRKKEKTSAYWESIFHEKEEYLAKDLFSLKAEEFSVMQLANVVDEIRVYSAERLWKIVVEEANLLSKLHVFKDFYFLGRGELFLAFFDQTRELTKLPLTSSTEHDLNRAFQFTARSVLYTDDNDAEKFHITVAKEAFDSPKVAERSRVRHLLNFIGLKHEVEWPLHIIFTPDALEKYSQIFRFLLSVRHVQQELHHCWMKHMRGTKNRMSCSNPWHMMFLINNLQYYLQIDVLESQFSQLIEKIKAEKDFEAIHHAHRLFLNTVIALSFLNWKPVHNCLKSIMSYCLEFCYVVASTSEPFDKADEEQLRTLISNFRRKVLVLLKILSVARLQQQSQNLGQLFLKIDYNKYFSTYGCLGGKFTDPQMLEDM